MAMTWAGGPPSTLPAGTRFRDRGCAGRMACNAGWVCHGLTRVSRRRVFVWSGNRNKIDVDKSLTIKLSPKLSEMEIGHAEMFAMEFSFPKGSEIEVDDSERLFAIGLFSDPSRSKLKQQGNT